MLMSVKVKYMLVNVLFELYDRIDDTSAYVGKKLASLHNASSQCE